MEYIEHLNLGSGYKIAIEKLSNSQFVAQFTSWTITYNT